MTKLTVFPMFFLFLLPGTGIKKYEHSYHTGSVTQYHLEPDQKPNHPKCQLDYTIIKDSLIVGRFQVINPPPDWKIIPEGTFHGVITKVIDEKNVSTNSTTPHYEWKSNCSFDDLNGHIKISKTIANAQGHDHFIGFVGISENAPELMFHLE